MQRSSATMCSAGSQKLICAALDKLDLSKGFHHFGISHVGILLGLRQDLFDLKGSDHRVLQSEACMFNRPGVARVVLKYTYMCTFNFTRRYGPLRGPTSFGQQKAYYAVLANFRQFLVFSSNLSNF